MINNYKNILDDLSFTYVDIGSRGGLSSEWEQVKNLMQVVLFEVDDKEAKKLKASSGDNTLVIPKAVWSHKGVVQFNSTRNPSYGSVLKPNKEILDGTYYYCRNFYKIEKSIDVEVDLLENILSEYNISNVDFLKIDIQGAENYIFDSMNNWQSIMGVHSEAYSSKLYEEGGDIAITLNKLYEKKFELYDLSVIADAPIVEIDNQNIFSKELLNARPKSGYKSRPMVYDLLLFKNKLEVLKSADKGYIRKMIFILCIYKYFDYALNLIIRSFNSNIFTKKEKDIIVNSIRNLHKSSLTTFQRFKENIKAPSYSLRKR